MALIPNEEYMARKETIYKDRKGILGLTNFRIIWTSEASATPEVILSYIHIQNIEKASERDKSFIRITRRDMKPSKLVFIFISDTHSEDMYNFFGHIESFIKRPQRHDGFYLLSKTSRVKISILEANSELFKIHKEFVRTGKMTEEDFWKNCEEFESYTKDQVHQNQIPGKLSSMIRIPHRFITNNKVIVDLLKKHKNMIFRQLPSEHKKFTYMVPYRKTEIDFWRTFWEDQLKIGNPMSDALEIIGHSPEEIQEFEPTEEISPHFSIYQTQQILDDKLSKNKQSQVFNQIAQQINNHSLFVISDAKTMPENIEAQFKYFEPVTLAEGSMKIDKKNCESQEWGDSVMNWFSNAKAEEVFITPNEAFETIRQIFKQIYICKPKGPEDGANANIYAKRIYQVLKFFYAELKHQKESIEKLEFFVNLAQSVFEEMRNNCKNTDSIELMENVICRAFEFLQMVKL